MRSANGVCSCSCHDSTRASGRNRTARPIIMPGYLHDELAAEYTPPAWRASSGQNGHRSPGGAQLRLWRSGQVQNGFERSVLRRIDGPNRQFYREVLPEEPCRVKAADAALSLDPDGEISGLVRIEDMHTVGQSMIRPGVRVLIETRVQESDAPRGQRPDPVRRQFVGIVHASSSEGICFRTAEGHMNHWCILHRLGASAWVHFMGREVPEGNWSDDDFAAHLERCFVPDGLVDCGCRGA